MHVLCIILLIHYKVMSQTLANTSSARNIVTIQS